MFRVPDVYTQFRKRVEEQCRIRPLQQMPDTLKPLPEGLEAGEIPTYAQLGQSGKTHFRIDVYII